MTRAARAPAAHPGACLTTIPDLPPAKQAARRTPPTTMHRATERTVRAGGRTSGSTEADRAPEEPRAMVRTTEPGRTSAERVATTRCPTATAQRVDGTGQ